ncbi:HepT-like ribonuclease domain-containing protein [Phormidesmis priestleyi]
MQANNPDAASIWDRMQAIRRIQEFTIGLSFDDYQTSILIQSAVERQLEILGEAAGRVSEAFRQTHPTLDWRRTVGLPPQNELVQPRNSEF